MPLRLLLKKTPHSRLLIRPLGLLTVHTGVRHGTITIILPFLDDSLSIPGTTSPYNIGSDPWICQTMLSPPQSQKLILTACPGCSLNNPTKLFKQRSIKPNKRTGHLPCVFNIEHEETVSLKEFHKGPLDPDGQHTLRCTYFHISHLIRESLRPHLSASNPTATFKIVDSLHVNLPIKQGLFFKYDLQFIKNIEAPRAFVKSIFDAQCFNNFINLQRCNFISFLTDTKSIDWLATWNRFKNCSPQPKSHTSFKKSAHVAFSTKLMLDELPLLHKLQTTRRPDLYDHSWNCFLCNEHKENWDHLWQCPVLKPRLSSLCSCTKLAFEDWIKENAKLQSIHSSAQWNNLSVWTYPDPSFYGITFDSLIKGLIPSDLTDELSKYLSKKDISEAINLVVSKAIDIFHEDIWAYRCQLFAEKEHTLGIDQSSKTTPSTRSTRQSPFFLSVGLVPLQTDG